MPRTNATTASPMAEIQRFEALSADVARPRSVNVGTSPPTQPPLPVDQSSVSASVRLEAVFVEEQKAELARLLRDAELQAASVATVRGDGPSLNRIEGRVLRELRALQLAFAAAKEEQLNVPTLKVRPALKSLLSSRNDGREA